MALATISMCQAASKTQYVMANHRAQRYHPGKLLRLAMESPGTALTQHLQLHLIAIQLLSSILHHSSPPFSPARLSLVISANVIE